MSEADRIDFEISYKELERAAIGVIDGAHRATALAWLSELNQHVDRVIERGELEGLVDWSARLDRLAANLPATNLTDHARGCLAGMLDRIERSAAVLSQQRDVEERAARRFQERTRFSPGAFITAWRCEEIPDRAGQMGSFLEASALCDAERRSHERHDDEWVPARGERAPGRTRLDGGRHARGGAEPGRSGGGAR